jgi:alpha-glucosidase (family GH31 glycosyl hydrolase)
MRDALNFFQFQYLPLESVRPTMSYASKDGNYQINEETMNGIKEFITDELRPRGKKLVLPIHSALIANETDEFYKRALSQQDLINDYTNNSTYIGQMSKNDVAYLDFCTIGAYLLQDDGIKALTELFGEVNGLFLIGNAPTNTQKERTH